MSTSYTDLPGDADVRYVDRKLRVARMMLRRADPEVRGQWLEIVDTLLDQRAMLAASEGGAR